ncbi:hypothetical protein FB451DRAFT_1030446, partial [Mycena latifolia]
EWGEDFRPVYRQLHRLRSCTGQEVPFVACHTATATSTFTVIWSSLGFGHRPFWGGSGRRLRPRKPLLLYPNTHQCP